MKRPGRTLGTVAAAALLFVQAGCGSGGTGAPATSGEFSVWSPVVRSDFDEQFGFSRWQSHFGALLAMKAEMPEEAREFGLSDSMILAGHVSAGDGTSASVDYLDLLVVCREMVRYEQTRFNPPMVIPNSGDLDVDLGWVALDTKFSDNGARYSGSWKSGECSGSWKNATMDDEQDDPGVFEED